MLLAQDRCISFRKSIQMLATPKYKTKSAVQGLQGEQDAVEREMRRGDPELSALKAWGEQIWDLMAAVEDIMKGLDVRAATPGPWMGFGLSQQQLTQLMPHFVQVSCMA